MCLDIVGWRGMQGQSAQRFEHAIRLYCIESYKMAKNKLRLRLKASV